MSVGNSVRVAIELECSAIKVGNVHPHASFRDMNHAQFVCAAKAIGESVDNCNSQSVGDIVLKSVQAMILAVGTNTSLGTILLMAPLVVATNHLVTNRTLTNRMGSDEDHQSNLKANVHRALSNLTPEDSHNIYEAIRTARPSGLGVSKSMDLRDPAPENILDAMKLAADRDDIALQYMTDFELVFSIARRLEIKQASGLSDLDSIRCIQVELLSERVDSLIARKQGLDMAKRVQLLADGVLAAGPYASHKYEVAWHRLDKTLRDEEHLGNPGTIADLIAAALVLVRRTG